MVLVALFNCCIVVLRFMNTFSPETEFCIKAPFITNRNHYHWYIKNDVAVAFRTVERALKKMYIQEISYAIPYIMLQERAMSNREVKLVFLGGKFKFISSCNIGSVYKSMNDCSDDELISFATDAVECISKYDKYVVDGVVRVDVLKNNQGELVVNELESLEARRFTADVVLQGNCNNFLETFWQKKIYDCIALLK